MADIGKCAQCFRILFIITNILFFIFGVIAFAIGIYLIVEQDRFPSVFSSTEYVAGAAIFIVCGIVSMLVTVMGIFGAIGMWRPLLILYIIPVVLIIILEIVAAILGFVYRNDIVGRLDETIDNLVQDYRVVNASDPTYKVSTNAAVDFLQNTFDCCGAFNASDYRDNTAFLIASNYSFPESCQCPDVTASNCKMFTFTSESGDEFRDNVWTVGCIDDTRNTLAVLGYTLGGVAIAFGIIEVISILIALGLICCITKSKKSVVV